MSASSKKKLRKEQNAAALTEKQQKAQAEAKKLKITSTIFVVVIVAVFIVALTAMAASFLQNSAFIKKNTTALTVGEHDINSVEMSYYFVDMVSNSYSEWDNMYGEYTTAFLSMMGLDTSKPLNKQTHSEGTTWADYFMEQAIDRATATYALYDEAVAAGHTMTDGELAAMENNISTLEMYAMFSQCDFDEYLVRYYGSGASEESLRAYMEVTNLAASYYEAYQESLTYDDAAIRGYEADKYDEFSSYSYTYCYLSSASFLPEGASGDPTDEQLEAALADAKAAADSLKNASNEKELNDAVTALGVSTVTANKKDNTLYTGINSVFRDWVTDDARQENDITTVPYTVTTTDANGIETASVQGYYVVQFYSSNDNVQPMANVRHLLVKFDEGEDGNVTQKMKDTAKAEADGYLETWLNGEATDESFAALVKEHSDDSSASIGGLFENVNPGSNFVTNFLNWCINPAREAGDAEVIETEYGYHVMYYVGDSEQTYRDHMIVEEMTQNDMEAWYDALVEATTVTEKNLNKVNTGLIISSFLG